MTELQKARILSLRAKNISYRDIADRLSLPIGTVKAFCSRQHIVPASLNCIGCGSPLPDGSRSNKRFCSVQCYRQWWEANSDHPRTQYTRTCLCCGKSFTVSSHAAQKYCSRACYVKSRKGVPQE